MTTESSILLESPLSVSGRSRIGTCPEVAIAATGSYVPDQIVTNEDLAIHGCDSDWIVQRTGIRQRRKAGCDQASSDLAYEAALKCLASAGVEPSDVDLVICATMTPDYVSPSTACVLQRRLGCIAPAFDVNAACSGFMYGLVTGGLFVRSGSARNALVRIIDAAVEHFGISREKVFVNLDKYGNTSAASIPMAIDDANRQGLLKRGDIILLCGFGAGLSWGTALLRW